jgi:hypothetical protein
VFGELTIVVNTVPPLVIMYGMTDYDYCTMHGICSPLRFY